ncbi:unnamed protein product [Pleuronectes platessa]|uniref:Uncharacterized protein n=1 Tax=Pleuronectes platessa TaxID=8262 RepID=A0A9N7UKW9_PLEPL|nr:unnamed protein product [Pleuronectes platessa]
MDDWAAAVRTRVLNVNHSDPVEKVYVLMLRFTGGSQRSSPGGGVLHFVLSAEECQLMPGGRDNLTYTGALWSVRSAGRQEHTSPAPVRRRFNFLLRLIVSATGAGNHQELISREDEWRRREKVLSVSPSPETENQMEDVL